MNHRTYLNRVTMLALVLWIGLVNSPAHGQHTPQQQAALNHQLIDSLTEGDDRKALTLIDQGADPNTRYAFLMACGAFPYGKAIPDIYSAPRSFSVSYTAQRYHADDTHLVQAMLKHGAKVDIPDDNGLTALIWATRVHRLNTVNLLLSNGANINVRDEDGATPLMSATHNSYGDLIRLLLRHKADVNKADNLGRTPLLYAVYDNRLFFERVYDLTKDDPRSHPNLDTVRLLLEGGADVNLPDERGETPLMEASLTNSALVRLLLEHGARVTAQDKEGWTALLESVSPLLFLIKDGREIIRLLLVNGADPNLANKSGKTPLMLAQQYNCPDVVALLKHYGAKK